MTKAVIGRAIELESGEEMPPGTIDSPDNHTDLWDKSRTLLRDFPELRHEEYFSIPRRRIFWKPETSSGKILMDSVLFDPGIKAKILEFFDLGKCRANWGRDLHYTTSQNDLSALFDDF